MAIENDVVAMINVAMTNGSRFTGELSFSAPNFDDSGIVNIQGNHINGFTINLARDLTSVDIGQHNVTITATQGGSSITIPFTFIVSGSAFGSHGLRPARYHDVDVFYRPIIVRVLTPTRYIETNTFYTPLVAIYQVRLPVFLNRLRKRNKNPYRYLTELRGTSISTISVVLTPSLYANLDTFYVPVVNSTASVSAFNVYYRRKRFVQRHQDFSVSAPIPEIPLFGPNEIVRRRRFVPRHKNESVSAPVPIVIYSSVYIEKRNRPKPRRYMHYRPYDDS